MNWNVHHCEVCAKPLSVPAFKCPACDAAGLSATDASVEVGPSRGLRPLAPEGQDASRFATECDIARGGPVPERLYQALLGMVLCAREKCEPLATLDEANAALVAYRAHRASGEGGPSRGAPAPLAPEEIDAGWIPTWQSLPDEEQVVEVAVLSGKHVRRGYGCRVDGGEGWTWALSHGGACENADDCEADDDYDVFAWREPTPLPEAPAERRFRILRDRGEDYQDEVIEVTGRDAAHAKMAEIGLAARCEELPP